MSTNPEIKSTSTGHREHDLTLQLGPSLPLSVFTSSERWHPERIGALAVYCSDGRWGDAFDEFCHKHLNLPRYDRWAVPGGPASLLVHDRNTNAVEYVREQVDFLVRAHGLQQIILITHYGCAFYAQELNLDADACLPHQLAELRQLAPLLLEWYPDLRIECYLAMRRHNCLSFHQVRV